MNLRARKSDVSTRGWSQGKRACLSLSSGRRLACDRARMEAEGDRKEEEAQGLKRLGRSR